jgi:hypothetical protein
LVSILTSCGLAAASQRLLDLTAIEVRVRVVVEAAGTLGFRRLPLLATSASDASRVEVFLEGPYVTVNFALGRWPLL